MEKSPFVERLLKKGYEVIYLIEPVDEYTIQSLPEFEGKKFQNIAKEGLNLDTSEKAKERKEALEKEFKPLTDWLKDDALKDKVIYFTSPWDYWFIVRVRFYLVLHTFSCSTGRVKT